MANLKTRLRLVTKDLARAVADELDARTPEPGNLDHLSDEELRDRVNRGWMADVGRQLEKPETRRTVLYHLLADGYRDEVADFLRAFDEGGVSGLAVLVQRRS